MALSGNGRYPILIQNNYAYSWENDDEPSDFWTNYAKPVPKLDMKQFGGLFPIRSSSFNRAVLKKF